MSSRSSRRRLRRSSHSHAHWAAPPAGTFSLPAVTFSLPAVTFSLPAVTFAVVALLLSACGGTGIEARDWAAEAEEQLLADGVRPQIVSCVLNVGRRELDRGPLSDAAADELLRNCRAADRVIDGADTIDEPDPELAMTDAPWTFGDDPELDLLWVDCEAGIGSACDLLFERSPVGSEYEDFGVGCGNRPELLRCAELDVQEETDS